MMIANEEFKILTEQSKEWEIKYEFSNIQSHSSIRMVDTLYPNSITEHEFFIIHDLIIKNNLKYGYEVATGFGISALAGALAFKQTGGKLVTMDSYYEEKIQDPLKDHQNSIFVESNGFKSVNQLIDKYKLNDILYPTIGYSPDDTNKCINDIFDENIKLNYIFIDGLHTPEAALNDFKVIENKIDIDNFVVIFHDGDGILGAINYAENYLNCKAECVSNPPHGFYMYVLQNCNKEKINLTKEI